MGGADLSADVDAAALRQPRIEQGDIGCGSRDATQGLSSRSGLPNDDEIVGRSEQVDQSSPNQLVIIKNEDSDGLMARHG